MSRDRLRSFFQHYLEYNGALIDPVGDSLETLLETDTAEKLACPESVRFAFDANHDGLFVGLGTEILDAALEEATHEIPAAYAHLEGLSLRGKNIIQDLMRDFTFIRCKPDAQDVVASVTPMTRVAYRLSMMSDESRETLFFLDFLEERKRLLPSGTSIPIEADELPIAGDDPRIRQFQPLPALFELIREPARVRATEAIGEFQKTLRHRLTLDLKRVREYNQGLLSGLSARLARGALTSEESEAKKSAIEADFLRQVEDLRRKFLLRVKLIPAAVLRMLLPVLRVRTILKIGKDDREEIFLWSPLTRAFEPFRCPACGSFGNKIEGTRQGKALCETCAAKS